MTQRTFGDRFRDALAAEWEMGGVPVLVWSNLEPPERREPQPYADKVSEAVELIRRHAPFRARELPRDFARIEVRRIPGHRAHFDHAKRACVLDTIFVTELSAAEVASSIIHESIHAKVGRKGWRLPMAREERLCRRAEMRFGVHLPEVPIVYARARVGYEHYGRNEYDIDLGKAHRESQQRLAQEMLDNMSPLGRRLTLAFWKWKQRLARARVRFQ